MKKTTLRYLAYASCAYALLHGSLFAQTVLPAGLGAMSVSQPSRDTAILSGVLLSNGGENPTVKIRWGDEDRGTAVTPAYAWDNEVTVSTSQAAGTFSTTIDIPNLDKIYYFRVVANNAGGAVVSRQLGVVLPNAPIGVANLQGRWSFDGENANDLSGALLVDDSGQYRHLPVPDGEYQRRESVKLLINLVLYALTSNYKHDQVHVAELLRRGEF